MPSKVDAVLTHLKEHANPRNVEGMAKFGIVGEGRLGISMPVLRTIARETGTDHPLALALWSTRIPEAMIVASMVADPAAISEEEMEAWASAFNSWDVCDQTCLNLFVHSPSAWKMVRRWSGREEEFVRRAAFALLACLAVHDKAAADTRFAGAFPLIVRAADDERNFVRKAVNWALRGIGKRNLVLHAAALSTARSLLTRASRTARWIAADAIKELENPSIRRRIKSSGGVKTRATGKPTRNSPKKRRIG
jgi:3-methyladenine DNA glycosylase AlkD